MTPRERNLLVLFLVVVAAVVVLMGLASYWDGLSTLDTQFVDLQKRVVKTAQSTALSQPASDTPLWTHLKDRFFAAGTLPGPLPLASKVQSTLRASGLSVQESKVVENTSLAQWVQYSAEGDISSWFRFLQNLRQQDTQSLFRSLSLVKKQGFSYSISFEVGHVVLP